MRIRNVLYVGFVLAAAFAGAGIAAIAQAMSSATSLQVVKVDKLGSVLADGTGNVLYMFTKDSANVSNCAGGCAQTWPPLQSDSTPGFGAGVNGALLGSTKRADGTTQVTYAGWPLYYFAKDAKPGDTTGQAVGGVWWVISPDGYVLKPAALSVAQNPKLGKILADDKGMTLYMFTKDSPNSSACYGGCATAWPPVISLGAPKLGPGLDASLIGTAVRKDGSPQLTYKGLPLYYWANDKAAGDATGQGVGSVWYVLAPDGTVVKSM